jgi:multisubunit Na+/H+ antiporter MnhB subunit
VSSSILRTAARILMPLLLLLALFLLWRGHNAPGGGFVAGLVIAIAYVLLMLADGVQDARRALLVQPRSLLGIGLLVALASGLVPWLSGGAFLTARWTPLGPDRWQLLVGTPLLFDVGVCLVVIGVVLTITFDLAED